MTQSILTPVLLIDGNNLAHFLYTNLVPGQKMTAADSRRLIEHLSSYARTYAGQVVVELCLDRSPGADESLPGNMQIFPAKYPQTGDDLILERFWFHHQAHRPCLVITNDEAILDQVSEEGGNKLRVSDFVRRAGLTAPVLRDPQDLPPLPVLAENTPSTEKALSHKAPSLRASIYFRIVEENRKEEKKEPAPGKTTRQANGQRPPPVLKPKAEPAQVPPSAPETARAAADAPGLERDKDRQNEENAAAIPAESSEDGPYYFLSLETWPVAEGIRFLRNAFCREHRAQYLDLLEAFDPQTLTPADLRALAELLLDKCGDELDFTRRGSLMSRVRAALLQARGEPLQLAQIAQATGLKQTGLHGRIKEKAENWLVIIQP